jgi:thioredoxin 1
MNERQSCWTGRPHHSFYLLIFENTPDLKTYLPFGFLTKKGYGTRTIHARIMPLCCIGGVCIPYTAVVPLLIYGIQWLLQKLAAAGLLPDTVCNYLKGLISVPPTKENKKGSVEHHSCCKSSGSSNVRRGKQTKHSLSEMTSSVSTTSSTHGSELPVTLGENSVVEMMESNENWEKLLTESPSVTFVCKFTADWCKPCKGMQPLFESLAASHRSVKFVTVDVDVLEDVAATYRIVSLPTIVAIRDGRVVDKYSGSDEVAIREFLAKVSRSVAS